MATMWSSADGLRVHNQLPHQSGATNGLATKQVNQHVSQDVTISVPNACAAGHLKVGKKCVQIFQSK